MGGSFDEEVPITDAIERARREKRVLEIRYLARRRAQTRSVEPFGVSTMDGFEYLIAYCRSTEIVRPFQLDRILSARLTEKRFTERRDGTNPREEPPTRAVVRFSPGASPSPDEGADLDLMEKHADGSTDYALYYADTGQAARSVMRHLGEAMALEPEELKREVRRRAESLLLRYKNRW
ncbi:MAG: WYL domain-containing protein [Actinomycetota bacterium]|nr:WYL domain-containing protein [Actinomycetota bacterium]